MGFGYADVENDVLRLRLKDAKQAGHRIKDLVKTARMNPDVRAQILKELETITNWYDKK